MVSLVSLFLVVFCCCVLSKSPDTIYTSNADMQNLLLTNDELVKQLRVYVRQEERRLQTVKRYIDQSKSLSEASSPNPESFVGNPLNAFVMIKHLTSNFRALQSIITTATLGDQLMRHVNATKTHLVWPTEEDLNGAAVGLFRLQDTYKLPTGDVAKGLLRGQPYSTALSARDRFELGRQAYVSGNRGMTTAWMQETLWALDPHSDLNLRVEALKYMAHTEYLRGNVTGALFLTQKMRRFRADHGKTNNNKAFFNYMPNKGKDKKSLGYDTCPSEAEAKKVSSRNDAHDMYQRLCRGEHNMDEALRSKLGCRFLFGSHPFLKYAPHKEEDVFLDPRIVVYHDVIYDSEIAVVKSLTIPKLKRSRVQNKASGKRIATHYRTSESAWLPRDSNVVIDSIYRRVGEVTGLNMETTEHMQIAHYGIGGHYEPHYDFSRPGQTVDHDREGTGNRIATWLFYGSEVLEGGHTVFPVLGVGVMPVKGSALFWFNLHRNGEGDTRTKHAACPVLVGNKWVSNFWFHERGQEQTRPCGLSTQH